MPVGTQGKTQISFMYQRVFVQKVAFYVQSICALKQSF
jgi:hypothetical protein